jgi:hypothetical protein
MFAGRLIPTRPVRACRKALRVGPPASNISPAPARLGWPEVAPPLAVFSLQQRKIVRHRLLNGFQFYPVVLMAEPVSHTTDIPPWHARNPALGFRAEPDRSLTDD